jgi:hypothetical protein
MPDKFSDRSIDAYRSAGRLLINRLWDEFAVEFELDDVSRLSPEKSTEVTAIIKKVFTLLAGEAAVERGIPTHPIGLATYARRKARLALSALFPDPDDVTAPLFRFACNARALVLTHWVTTEAVADTLFANPDALPAEIAVVLSESEQFLELAEAYRAASTAAVHQMLGESVQMISLCHTSATSLHTMRVDVQEAKAALDTATIATVGRNPARRRDGFPARVAALHHELEVTIPAYTYRRVDDYAVAELFWKSWRFAGEINSSSNLAARTTALDALTPRLVAVLAGEQAVRLSTGLDGTNVDKRIGALQALTLVMDSPAAVIEHLAVSEAHASGLVAHAWPGIVAVADALPQCGELTGEEFLDIFVAAMPPCPRGLVASLDV